MTFWEEVARDVSNRLKETAPEIPSWDELTEPGKKSLEAICIEAVKAVAKKGKAHLPAEVEPDTVA